MSRRVWLIFFVFLALRFVLAIRLPIFNDESTYMRWGWGFLADPGRWWAWMLDGKQPAVAISFGLAQKLPVDPLFSMRLVSILWSTVTFWTVYAIARRFLAQTHLSGLLLLVAFCPFLILFDTLALAESAVTASFAVALYFTLSFVTKPAVWKGIAAGVVVALGWWFKSTALLSVPLIGLTVVLYWKTWMREWRSVALGLVLGSLVGFGIMAPVLFNPDNPYSSTAVIPRIMTVGQIASLPRAQWMGNAIAIISWFVGYGGPLLIAASVWVRWRAKGTRVLAVWLTVPIIIEGLFLTSLSARLLAISIIPLLLAVGIWLGEHKTTWLKLLVVGSVAFEGVVLSFSPLEFYKMLKPIPVAAGDFGQYVTSWPSGYGVKESIELLVREAGKQPIVVFIRLDGGNPEDAVIAYLSRAKVPVVYVEQIDKAGQVKALADRPWYFVSRGAQYAGLEGKLSEIARFKKPLDEEFVGVYRINK